MVWDIGTYEVMDGNYWKGFLSIFLAGKKLKGEWSLQRIDSEDAKTKWLLRKTGANAKPVSAKKDDTSAQTGRSMQKIAGDRSAVWNSNRNGKQASAKTSAPTRSRVMPMPRFIKPMKATAVNQLSDNDEWIYEIKWDGYRVLAAKGGDQVRLHSL